MTREEIVIDINKANTQIDMVSRDAVIDRIGMNSIIKSIERLPPATPSRRKGHWIQLDYQRGKFECSECHTQGYVDTCMYEPKWKYCPICGAEMVESQESEE